VFGDNVSTHLTEEEQLVLLKRWWIENGRSIMIGVVLAVGGYFAWQYWQNQQAQASVEAAVLYEEFSQSIFVNDGAELTAEQRDKAIEIAAQLKSDFSNTLFASNAALFMAKDAAEQNDLERAENELKWVLDNNSGETIALLARQRLAQVELSKENYGEALNLLSVEAIGFESSYSELKGDVYFSKQEYNSSLQAYEKAMDTLLPTQANRRPVIQMKLDAVRPLVASSTEASTTEESTSDVVVEEVEG
jgi:predicted negative regulator of RcsB-dependent stress response